MSFSIKNLFFNFSILSYRLIMLIIKILMDIIYTFFLNMVIFHYVQYLKNYFSNYLISYKNNLFSPFDTYEKFLLIDREKPVNLLDLTIQVSAIKSLYDLLEVSYFLYIVYLLIQVFVLIHKIGKYSIEFFKNDFLKDLF